MTLDYDIILISRAAIGSLSTNLYIYIYSLLFLYITDIGTTSFVYALASLLRPCPLNMVSIQHNCSFNLELLAVYLNLSFFLVCKHLFIVGWCWFDSVIIRKNATHKRFQWSKRNIKILKEKSNARAQSLMGSKVPSKTTIHFWMTPVAIDTLLFKMVMDSCITIPGVWKIVSWVTSIKLRRTFSM